MKEKCIKTHQNPILTLQSGVAQIFVRIKDWGNTCNQTTQMVI